MRETSIARNYAEALLALARKANDTAGWGASVSALGDAVAQDVTLRRFLEAPQVSAAQKNAVLGKALAGAAPNFVRFVQKLVSNRRQMLLPVVATEYHNLLDEAEGRVHARVTVAREFDAATREAMTAALTCGASRKLRSVASCATASPSALTAAPHPAVSFALRARESRASA